MSRTESEYLEIVQNSFEIFKNKNKDYGTSWKILRLPSLTDQIYIKAQRIRTIQELGFSKVEENQEDGFYAMINYCVMALMLIAEQETGNEIEEPEQGYLTAVEEVKSLLFNKNHDYNEAWRNMRVSSMTDIILMKLLRIKQIEDNEGQTIASEGVKGSYQDIINYSVFCLIKLSVKDQIQVSQQ